MKTSHSRADAAQFQPAAERSWQDPVQVPHGATATPHGVLQAAIDQSPRVLAQRRMLQAAFGSAFQHRSDSLGHEMPMQRRFNGANAHLPNQASKSSESSDALKETAAASVNETGMPNQLKSGIEALSGIDVSNVRVRRNSIKPAQLNALAYAQGDEIHLGQGQERQLPHEAWHVVQQVQGRVLPTLRTADGVAVNDDIGLEREADVMGARALQRVAGPGQGNAPAFSEERRNAASPTAASRTVPPGSGAVVQRADGDWTEQISQALGIAASAAREFVQYLLRNYPVHTIVGTILVGGLLAGIYANFRGATAVEGEEDEGNEGDEGDEKDATEEVDDEPGEEELEYGAASESESEDGSSSISADGASETISDFRWDGKTAKRNKSIAWTPYRLEQWDKFNKDGPPKKAKKKRKAPRPNLGMAIYKSKKDAQAASVAHISASAPYDPYSPVVLPGSTPFFVDTSRLAEGTRSSSLAGKAGTKFLAVVYGRHGAASSGASQEAEVHVHFNSTNPVDGHTGAHVKIGMGYPFSWASGDASAQADLASILDLGFRGDRWKRHTTYVK